MFIGGCADLCILKNLRRCEQNCHTHYNLVLSRKAYIKSVMMRFSVFKFVYQRTRLNKELCSRFIFGLLMMFLSVLLVLELYHTSTTIVRSAAHTIIYNLTLSMTNES